MENKKILFLVAGIIAIAFIALVAVLFINDGKTGKYLSDYKRLALDNRLAVNGDYSDCSNKKACIKKTVTLISEGLNLVASFNGYDKNEIKTNTEEINKLVEKGKYKDSFEKSQQLVTKVSNKTNDYIEKNKTEFKEIKTVINNYLQKANFTESSVINYHVSENWAVATVVTNNSGIDPANVVLKKTGTWAIVEGPDTYFERNSIKFISAPSDITDNLNSFYPVAFIDNEGRLNPDFSPRSYTFDSESEKLLALVPYYADTFSVTSQTKNGLITFLVITDIKYKNDIKDVFFDWLKTNKIDPNGILYEFRYDDTSKANYDQSR